MKSFVTADAIPAHLLVITPTQKRTHRAAMRGLNKLNELVWRLRAADAKYYEAAGYTWREPIEVDLIVRGALKKQAARGGRALKPDWLNSQICGIVEKSPDISEMNLRKKLSKHPDIEFLDHNDFSAWPALATKICYPHRGGTKGTPASGLKHRLFRAKQNRAKRIARLN